MAEDYSDVTIYDGNEGMFYIYGDSLELEGNESIFSKMYPIGGENGTTTFLYNPNYTIEMEFSGKKKYLFYGPNHLLL